MAQKFEITSEVHWKVPFMVLTSLDLQFYKLPSYLIICDFLTLVRLPRKPVLLS